MRSKRGFTLIEILLVVAIIAILAGIVIIAINPAKQFADTRNTQRKADLNTILNSVYQYTVDNNGILPTSLVLNSAATAPTCNTALATANPTYQICSTSAASCTGLTDLTVLTTSQKYLVTIPTDPLGAVNSNVNGTGYLIYKNSNGRVTVCAPSAEQSVTINYIR